MITENTITGRYPQVSRVVDVLRNRNLEKGVQLLQELTKLELIAFGMVLGVSEVSQQDLITLENSLRGAL